MILYLPFNVYGYPEVITDIKLYICLKYTLHLYIMDDKNILPTNILTSLVTYNNQSIPSRLKLNTTSNI